MHEEQKATDEIAKLKAEIYDIRSSAEEQLNNLNRVLQEVVKALELTGEADVTLETVIGKIQELKEAATRPEKGKKKDKTTED